MLLHYLLPLQVSVVIIFSIMFIILYLLKLLSMTKLNISKLPQTVLNSHIGHKCFSNPAFCSVKFITPLGGT